LNFPPNFLHSIVAAGAAAAHGDNRGTSSYGLLQNHR